MAKAHPTLFWIGAACSVLAALIWPSRLTLANAAGTILCGVGAHLTTAATRRGNVAAAAVATAIAFVAGAVALLASLLQVIR